MNIQDDINDATNDTEFAKNELNYIQKYESIGFTDQYRVVNDKLENLTTKDTYSPEHVLILKEHRYEGLSDPADMSLLYVIQTTDGSKGTILANYGANADNSIHEFMNKVPKPNSNPDMMTPPDAVL